MDRDPQLKNVLIKAEISNLSFDRNKNMYITLKDENTLMPAIMFSSQNHTLKFKPENGMSVLVEGNVSVYEKGGKYQLYILDMERSEEHTSELQSRGHLVCRLLLEKKKKTTYAR